MEMREEMCCPETISRSRVEVFTRIPGVPGVTTSSFRKMVVSVLWVQSEPALTAMFSPGAARSLMASLWDALQH